MIYFRRYDPEVFHRRSIRLPEFDYSSKGYYFVTVCVRDPDIQLSTIKSKRVQLTETGKIVSDFWEKIPGNFHYVELDSLMIMPDDELPVHLLRPQSPDQFIHITDSMFQHIGFDAFNDFHGDCRINEIGCPYLDC